VSATLSNEQQNQRGHVRFGEIKLLTALVAD